MSSQIHVLGTDIRYIQYHQDDFISLTDIAKYKGDKSDVLIQSWMRNRNTVEFLGLWETLNNPNFKPHEFEGFRKDAGLNSFLMSPKKRAETTDAIGIISKSGKYGGTYAHKDIAFEFANWISVEFRLYFIKEFQRLQQSELQALDWNTKRFLTKINYRIHTDAIQTNLIPKLLSQQDINAIYAHEADILNKALFGMTAKEWKDRNPGSKGNMRDEATLEQLIILANIESMNAEFIRMGVSQTERLETLNKIAITQMESLLRLNTTPVLAKN